ncbi:SAM-dependent methyltransferase, partial [Spirillospora sp. NPDC049652]
DTLTELAVGAGLTARETHGVRIFADLVPSALLDDVGAAEDLVALERAASVHPVLRELATQLHLVAERP